MFTHELLDPGSDKLEVATVSKDFGRLVQRLARHLPSSPEAQADYLFSTDYVLPEGEEIVLLGHAFRHTTIGVPQFTTEAGRSGEIKLRRFSTDELPALTFRDDARDPLKITGLAGKLVASHETTVDDPNAHKILLNAYHSLTSQVVAKRKTGILRDRYTR